MTDGAPEAWPLLMSREIACAYLGLSADTFGRICPVSPIDLGVRVIRWRRPDLDAWIAGLPIRLRPGADDGEDAPVPPPPAEQASTERRLSAVERARQRSMACPTPRRSRSSSASSVQTAG